MLAVFPRISNECLFLSVVAKLGSGDLRIIPFLVGMMREMDEREIYLVS